MRIYNVNNFGHGLLTRIEPQSIPDGSAADSLNFVFKADKLELRRGSLLLGTTVDGAGKVTGLGVGTLSNGTQLLYKTYAQKVLYYDTTTSDWIEIGIDMLPAAASGEDVSFAAYTNLAGSQMLLSSPNSSIYKIMNANPGSITDLLSTTYRGYLKIGQGRSFLWNQQGSTGGKDKTSVYGSYIDKDELSDYTQIAGEAIGVLGSLTYSGTLAFKAAGPKRTCFFVTFADTAETFTDNYDGTLSGTLGGTGTINYTTGVYSITFASAAAGAVTATYYWEDSTSTGVADFSKSTPRTAGQGFVMPQPDAGGNLQGIAEYQDSQYCIHRFGTNKLTLGQTDTSATNLPFRKKVGIPNWRAYCETGDGVYYVDDVDEADPHIRLLTLNVVSTEVVPVSVSEALDLSNYRFDHAAMAEWGNFVLVACRTSDSAANNRVLAYDRIIKNWAIHDWWVSCFAVYNGTLVGGSSVTNDAFTLFSGSDDDDSTISGHWIGGISLLAIMSGRSKRAYPIPSLKKVKRMVVQGEIGPSQHVEVHLSLDNGQFVLVGQIDGDGTYVDKTQSVDVGAVTVGRIEVGGGGEQGEIPAYNYIHELSLGLAKFRTIQLKLQPTGLGYFSVAGITWKDIRIKEMRLASKYRA